MKSKTHIEKKSEENIFSTRNNNITDKKYTFTDPDFEEIDNENEKLLKLVIECFSIDSSLNLNTK